MSATETAESTLPTHPKIHDKVLSKNIILYKYMRPQRCVASSRLIHMSDDIGLPSFSPQQRLNDCF